MAEIWLIDGIYWVREARGGIWLDINKCWADCNVDPEIFVPRGSNCLVSAPEAGARQEMRNQFWWEPSWRGGGRGIVNTVLGLKSQKCWKVLLFRHRERFMLSYSKDKERKWRCSITSYLLAVLYSTELYYAGVEETVLQEVGDSGWQLEVAGLPTVTPVWRWEIRNDNVPACQQNTAGLQHGDNYIYINHMISSVSFLSISCPPSRVSWSVIAMLATAQAGRCIRKESY